MTELTPFFDKIPITKLVAGTTLQSTGKKCEYFMMVISGKIRVYTISLDGRDKTIYKIEKSGVCVVTTSCLLSGRPFPVVAEAQTDVELKLMNINEFKDLLDRSSRFQGCILTILSSKIGSLIDTISLLNTFSVQTRLYKWLLNQREPTIHATHSDIANDIGSSREVISRHLKRLEMQGVISAHRGELIITKREHLEILI